MLLVLRLFLILLIATVMDKQRVFHKLLRAWIGVTVMLSRHLSLGKKTQLILERA